ncbi:hypothetical protein C1I95_30205 [Micromonospora craterilacus]|uniref:Uncharacterized protein n=1 Tax=Micromonospora craterilacus TaxID=1655439 RepID=A0A2W2EV50_9ACTN|nr:hypothetical protein [Micromonospora craterilacus]PZG08214.1 hypothetical protein C1I95_30205 [Micromonospora craterilacus]
MTSPAEPPPNAPTPASQVTRPLRELAAIVLLGANAIFLFVGLIRLLAPQGPYSTVTGRAGNSFFAFIGLEAIVLPVLAVLLATHVAPVVPRAKLIVQVALGEYAASAVLGGLTLLIWVVGRLAEAQLFDAMTGILARAAWVALFGIAAYVVWTVWQRLYHVPRPKPQPGVYGTPQPGWPQPGGGYGAGQAGGFPSPGPTGGSPAAGQPAGWPVAGQPAAPAGGPPSAPHTWPPHGQPAVPPQSAAPSAPPFGQPASADPTQTIPRQGAEPTQAIPRPDGDADRTQRIDPGESRA